MRATSELKKICHEEGMRKGKDFKNPLNGPSILSAIKKSGHKSGFLINWQLHLHNFNIFFSLFTHFNVHLISLCKKKMAN